MPQMVYTDQSADELRLSVVLEKVRKKELNVICTSFLRLPFKNNNRLEIGIIGASHYIELSNPSGKVALTEVLACIKLNNVRNKLIDSCTDVTHVSFRHKSLSYSFNSNKYNWKSGKVLFAELKNKAEKSNDHTHRGLVYTFPSDSVNIFPPTTVVLASLNLKSKKIKVRTLHAYPNEDTIVFTTTIIKELEGDLQ